MNTNEYNNLHIIADVCDLPEGATYYSWEGFHTRTIHQEWITIYDADFRVLEAARVKYTSVIALLQRVARHEDHDAVLLAFVRTPLNDQYDLITADDDTIHLLEAACRSVM